MWELLNMITHMVSCIPVDKGRRYRDRARRNVDTASALQKIVASSYVEPCHLHDAQRARVDVKHTSPTRGACLCIQYDRARHGRLEDDAPVDVELGAEHVRAGGQDNAGDGCVGECTEQAGNGSHRHDPRQ